MNTKLAAIAEAHESLAHELYQLADSMRDDQQYSVHDIANCVREADSMNRKAHMIRNRYNLSRY